MIIAIFDVELGNNDGGSFAFGAFMALFFAVTIPLAVIGSWFIAPTMYASLDNPAERLQFITLFASVIACAISAALMRMKTVPAIIANALVSGIICTITIAATTGVKDDIIMLYLLAAVLAVVPVIVCRKIVGAFSKTK